jgi:hypothetical protein
MNYGNAKKRVLHTYLAGCGYNSEDIDAMVKAYMKDGLEAAVETFAWADTSQHSYTDELKYNLQLFKQVVL